MKKELTEKLKRECSAIAESIISSIKKNPDPEEITENLLHWYASHSKFQFQKEIWALYGASIEEQIESLLKQNLLKLE